jgi:tetratricopeptide (TPR) repeat protein
MAWAEHTDVNWKHWDLTAWQRQSMPERVLARFREDQSAFDIRFLEDALVRAGETSDILNQLGHLYTQVGRYRDGLAIDRRIVNLRPRDPVSHYNLACSYSLLKQTTRAFGALKKAMELGYRDIDHMLTDPDLENLRRDPRWGDLVGVRESQGSGASPNRGK